MPKITGPNIAKHVADQEKAVFDAAIRLFAEQGVENVAMAAIAAEVGLARSSLYRYFPTKGAIVHRWFERSMGPLIADSNEIARSDATRAKRFTKWIERQTEFLSEPANQAMIRASVKNDEPTEEQRASIGAGHRDLYESLHSIINGQEATGTESPQDSAIRLRVLLIAGLLRDLPDLTDGPYPDPLIRSEILRAARRIAGIDAAAVEGSSRIGEAVGEVIEAGLDESGQGGGVAGEKPVAK